MTVQTVDGIVNGSFIFWAFGKLQSYFIASWPHLFSKANIRMTAFAHKASGY